MWTCPDCQVDLARGAGIKLLGSHSDLNEDEGTPHVLAFEFHCPACSYGDHFKIALDQYGQCGTGGGLEG